MLSIEEIKLFIEKLERLKSQDFQKLIDDNLKILKDLHNAVEAANSIQIAKLDKTAAWFLKDLEWREQRKDSIEDNLLFQNIDKKIKEFGRLNQGLSNSLEIGPGYGRFSKCFNAWRLNYFLDIIPHFKEKILNLFPELQQRYIKFYTTPWHDCHEIPNSAVNFVFSWDTFTFFSQLHIKRYLKEIFRVTIPGGYILLHYSNCEYDHDLNEARRGYWNYNTRAAMIQMVKDSGYNVITTEQFCPGANYIIFQKPGNTDTILYKTFEIPATK
jgi:SAM-dependent methyltransferase